MLAFRYIALFLLALVVVFPLNATAESTELLGSSGIERSLVRARGYGYSTVPGGYCPTFQYTTTRPTLPSSDLSDLIRTTGTSSTSTRLVRRGYGCSPVSGGYCPDVKKITSGPSTSSSTSKRKGYGCSPVPGGYCPDIEKLTAGRTSTGDREIRGAVEIVVSSPGSRD